MLNISQLFIYPVKSLGGIAVNSALLTDRGFEHDRRWMITGKDNCFITQRELPAMALLQVQLTGTGLHIYHKKKSAESIDIPFAPLSPDTVMATVWDDVCEVQRVDPEVDEWLSDMLSYDCRLLYMPDNSWRSVDARYAIDNDITSLSDGYPALMIGQASLDDLNGRLAVPLPMNRFRPNMVFSGGRPYEEDEMAHFTIAGMDFYAVKPCARCPIPTIDQDTALAAKEPLRTLATYRNKNNKVYFGQNILYKGRGVVQVGDSIAVLARGAGIDF